MPGRRILFIKAIWGMANDPETDDVITWNDSGTSIRIPSIPRLIDRKILSKYFKHNSYNSLDRQFSFYRFTRRSFCSNPGADDVVYSHPHFVRDKPELMDNIKRLKEAPSHSGTRRRRRRPAPAPAPDPRPKRARAELSAVDVFVGFAAHGPVARESLCTIMADRAGWSESTVKQTLDMEAALSRGEAAVSAAACLFAAKHTIPSACTLFAEGCAKCKTHAADDQRTSMFPFIKIDPNQGYVPGNVLYVCSTCRGQNKSKT